MRGDAASGGKEVRRQELVAMVYGNSGLSDSRCKGEQSEMSTNSCYPG